MRSLISNYAIEGRLADGSGPNGAFYMTKSAVEETSQDVVQQHFGWTGEKNSNYVKSQLEKLWPHTDVLNEGFIDVEKTPQLLKRLLGVVEIENSLQVQLEDDVAPYETQFVNFRPDHVNSPWSATPAAAPEGKLVGAYTKKDELS